MSRTTPSHAARRSRVASALTWAILAVWIVGCSAEAGLDGEPVEPVYTADSAPPENEGDQVSRACTTQEETPDGCAAPTEAPASIPPRLDNGGEGESVEEVVPACGGVITSIDGVAVYSNGRYQGTGSSCGGCGHTFGCHYQCVNLATRYAYYRLNSGATRWGVASALQMCDTHPRNIVTKWRGSGYVPRHGDLFVLGATTGNPWGHVAVVDYARDGYAYVVEQNGSHNGRNRYALGAARCLLTSSSNTSTAPAPTTTFSPIVVDNNNANNNSARARMALSGVTWTPSSTYPGYYSSGYHYASPALVPGGATFSFYVPAAGARRVSAWWSAGANRNSSAPFVMFNAQGTSLGTRLVDQRSNGGRWVSLGTYNFSAGWNSVVLSPWTRTTGFLVADAIRIE